MTCVIFPFLWLSAVSYAVRFFFGPTWAFQHDALRPQSDAVGRVLLGMSPHLPSKRYPAMNSVSAGAVRNTADYDTSQNLTKKSQVYFKSEKGLFSDERQLHIVFCLIVHRGQKTRTAPLGKRIFEAGTPRTDLDSFRDVKRLLPQFSGRKRTCVCSTHLTDAFTHLQPAQPVSVSWRDELIRRKLQDRGSHCKYSMVICPCNANRNDHKG